MRRALLLTAALAVSLLPATAYAQPTIQLINPSAYSPAVEVSDVGRPYHLVAVASGVAAPAVEFDIKVAGQNDVTFPASRVGGTDTFEAFVTIPSSVPEGPATVQARLQVGNSEISDSVPVTINRSTTPLPPAAETAEITYPSNAGKLGFFTPKGGAPRAIVEGVTSDGAEQARVLFSTVPTTAEPVWVQCGSAVVGAGNSVRARCTLPDGTDPLTVTALAMVANVTMPPLPPATQGDDSGDAHRVFPYVQRPAVLNVVPGSVKVDPRTCPLFSASVLDQEAQPIQGVNVDVHATGPDDQLRFGSISNQTSAFQAPNDGHGATEQAWNCSTSSSGGTQGDHNVFGGPDVKHIESTAGTNNNGIFSFALRSETAGGTHVLVWADADDDDTVPSATEATGGAQIGWGEDPPPPVTEVLLSPAQAAGEVGTCQKIDMVVRRGGNPVAGANVDVHLSAPAVFCDVEGSDERSDPDAGGHVAGAHEDGTRHAEGVTSPTGRFVFGVTSPTEGTTTVLAWLDVSDDDVLIDEPARTGAISWAINGEREVDAEANKRRVRRGGRVRISGAIQAVSDTCEDDEPVKLKARRRGRKFRTIRNDVTGDDGTFSFRVKVRRTKQYKVVAPRNEACERAASNTITVRRK